MFHLVWSQSTWTPVKRVYWMQWGMRIHLLKRLVGEMVEGIFLLPWRWGCRHHHGDGTWGVFVVLKRQNHDLRDNLVLRGRRLSIQDYWLLAWKLVEVEGNQRFVGGGWGYFRGDQPCRLVSNLHRLRCEWLRQDFPPDFLNSPQPLLTQSSMAITLICRFCRHTAPHVNGFYSPRESGIVPMTNR